MNEYYIEYTAICSTRIVAKNEENAKNIFLELLEEDRDTDNVKINNITKLRQVRTNFETNDTTWGKYRYYVVLSWSDKTLILIDSSKCGEHNEYYELCNGNLWLNDYDGRYNKGELVKCFNDKAKAEEYIKKHTKEDK